MTPRQEEARRLALSGLTVKQIAVEMGITRQGVEHHLKAIGALPHRVPKYNDEQIVTLHREGFSDADIAHEVGICVATVMAVRHRLGIKSCLGPTPVLSPAEVERLLALACQGWRQVDLAKEFGIAQITVSKYLIKNGVRRYKQHTRKAKQ